MLSSFCGINDLESTKLFYLSTIRWTIWIFATVFALLAGSTEDTFAGGDCSNTSMGMIPLFDLGSELYQGMQGGLYPGGLNVPPSAHASAGLAIADNIRPFNANGEVDEANGAIVLVTIGMSNTRIESELFVDLGSADPEKNPRLTLVNGALSDASADRIADPDYQYWGYVHDQVAKAGRTDSQVQVAWILEATPHPRAAFPTEAIELQGYLEDIVRNLKIHFPNIKLVYFSSRIYAGYAVTSLNPEPHAYESGFAVKWAIEKQINGDPALNYNPANGAVVAPYLAWGPYLWADGLTPRSDGLIWECDDLKDDGTHPSFQGGEKVANLLLDFFKSDPTTVLWFLENNVTSVEMSNFNAQTQGSDVILHWVTTSEVNNLGVEIQRKHRQADFKVLTFVKGKVMSDVSNSYDYIDKRLQPGEYSYRLGYTDSNGSLKFSSVATVHVQPPMEFVLKPNFPNPFRRNTSIFFEQPERALVNIRIYNVLGQVVAQLFSGEREAGSYSVQWNGLDLQQRPVAYGVYFVTLWRQTPDRGLQMVSKRSMTHIR